MVTDDNGNKQNIALGAETEGGVFPDYAGPGYEWPSNPRTAAALEHWRDLKLGVIIHWGIYAYINQEGSWSLHRNDLGWYTDPPEDWEGTDAEYHTWYFNNMRYFEGADLDPEQWARECAEAGFKYLVFTAKHHDGFAMYDTQFSNYKATSEDCGLRRDVVRQMFDAYREHGIETGVYFSKPDWNHPGYWDRARPITDRRHNYDIEKEPARWQNFVDYTHRQIEELLANYGKINLLWMDGVWTQAPAEPVQINELARKARALQPDILVVDRGVHGPEENYRTPEKQIPDHYLPFPWESCLTWTSTWCSIEKDQTIKPTREIVSNLLKIVARNGNYLVGFGPDKTGALSKHLIEGMKQLGAWMAACGDGVYGTRAMEEHPVVEASDSLEWESVTKGDDLIVYGISNTDEVPASRCTVEGAWSEAIVYTAEGKKNLSVSSCHHHGKDATTVSIPAAPTPYATVVRFYR